MMLVKVSFLTKLCLLLFMNLLHNATSLFKVVIEKLFSTVPKTVIMNCVFYRVIISDNGPDLLGMYNRLNSVIDSTCMMLPNKCFYILSVNIVVNTKFYCLNCYH